LFTYINTIFPIKDRYVEISCLWMQSYFLCRKSASFYIIVILH
jgi:hypothetical protein